MQPFHKPSCLFPIAEFLPKLMMNPFLHNQRVCLKSHISFCSSPGTCNCNISLIYIASFAQAGAVSLWSKCSCAQMRNDFRTIWIDLSKSWTLRLLILNSGGTSSWPIYDLERVHYSIQKKENIFTSGLNLMHFIFILWKRQLTPPPRGEKSNGWVKKLYQAVFANASLTTGQLIIFVWCMAVYYIQSVSKN